MTEILRPADVELAVSAVKSLDAEIARLQAQRSQYVANILAATRGTGKVPVGITSITVSENNVYSEDAMREALLPGQVRRCSVLKLDKATVKRLYPAVYEAARENRGRKVTIA